MSAQGLKGCPLQVVVKNTFIELPIDEEEPESPLFRTLSAPAGGNFASDRVKTRKVMELEIDLTAPRGGEPEKADKEERTEQGVQTTSTVMLSEAAPASPQPAGNITNVSSVMPIPAPWLPQSTFVQTVPGAMTQLVPPGAVVNPVCPLPYNTTVEGRLQAGEPESPAAPADYQLERRGKGNGKGKGKGKRGGKKDSSYLQVGLQSESAYDKADLEEHAQELFLQAERPVIPTSRRPCCD